MEDRATRMAERTRLLVVEEEEEEDEVWYCCDLENEEGPKFYVLCVFGLIVTAFCSYPLLRSALNLDVVYS